jgi:MerR family transcriptional regulator, light-induced transcriptional regulator
MGSMREGLLGGGWTLNDTGERAERTQETAADDPSRRGFDAERLGRLAGVIEGEIIPRLMMAHRADINGRAGTFSNGHAEDVNPVITPAQVEEFSDLVLSDDADRCLGYCVELLARGASSPELLLGLLAPSARRFGELWDEDLIDFTAVTVALCRLQQVMRELGQYGELWAGSEDLSVRRVLLTPMPGEQHTFGTLMVGEFFRRAGWEVEGDGALSVQEIVHRVRRDWYAVVGLSVACDTDLAEVARVIGAIRDASRNPTIGVLVGGKVFSDDPALARQVGADATAVDAEGALELAQEMLVRCAVRC